MTEKVVGFGVSFGAAPVACHHVRAGDVNLTDLFAVDRERGSVDVGRFVRSEERCQRGDVARLTEALQRNIVQQRSQLGLLKKLNQIWAKDKPDDTELMLAEQVAGAWRPNPNLAADMAAFLKGADPEQFEMWVEEPE